MKKLLRILWILIVLVAAFFVIKTQTTRFEWTPTTMLANPASVYCEQQSGTLEIVTDASGAQSGICHLVDGTICEEWAYFRGECHTTSPGQACTEEAKLCPDGSAVGRTWPNCEFAPCPGEEPTACTMQYDPVCASVAVQCVKAPCQTIEQTFWNMCVMNANKLATFLHKGECTADKTDGTSCPLLSAPSPDFCVWGTIISRGKDAKGCDLPPLCQK